MKYIELHKHTHFSLFDGYGTCKSAAEYAKEIGYDALSITDHGNINGLVNHYEACKEVGIKPILGCEAYFQPEFEKKGDKYHLTLLAKNLTGYKNLNKIITQANRENYYRNGKVTFRELEQYNEGIIALSGCVGGYVQQLILDGADEEDLDDFEITDENYNKAKNAAQRFKDIFGDDFFLEVMPVELDIQKHTNEAQVNIGNELNINIVMTNDAHYVRPDEFDTYRVMHWTKDSEPDSLYQTRYMHTAKSIKELWLEMHPDIDPDDFIKNTQVIADRIEEYNLDFDEMIPKQAGSSEESRKKLVKFAKEGLKGKGKWNDEYKDQLRKELEVVFSHGFEDYFLLTRDIVKFAKDNNISTGFGRGSVGDFLLAYALGITDLDAVKLDTAKYYERFLRKDKKKFPDIDLDFDSNRRDEVIDFLIREYEGKAAQIAAFGYYKEKNLMNDLAKVLDIPDDARDKAKTELCEIIDGGEKPPLGVLKSNKKLKTLDNRYEFLDHFYRLYNQIRYIGKHAGGVAVTPDDITNYVGLQKYRGSLQTAYDLEGLEKLNVLKMDVLGLSTLSAVGDAERVADVEWDESYLDDDKVYEEFGKGNTAGVFQFEKEGAKDVLRKVNPKNMQELIACNALNRPAPKQLGILDEYVEAKNGGINSDKPWTPYSKDTYGSLIFQEQVMNICREVGEMSWDDTDKVMKSLRKGAGSELREKFVKGATKNGLTEKEAYEMYDKMTLYLFNKGHGAAYSLLSFYTMWLKINHPVEFFYGLLKNEKKDHKRGKYAAEAVQNDIVIMLAHVNGGAGYTIQDIDGDRAIQEGLTNIKGIGAKTAKEIEKRAPYKSAADFDERVPGRYANKTVKKKLREEGALLFKKKTYWNRVIDYNAFLDNRDVTFY